MREKERERDESVGLEGEERAVYIGEEEVFSNNPKKNIGPLKKPDNISSN